VSADESNPASLEEEWSEWRDERERQLAHPLGLLAATGLHWLTSDPTRFEDVPGQWSIDNDEVQVDLADGETLTLGDATLSGRYNFGVIEDGSRVMARFDDAAVEIAARNGRGMIRPRHPDHELVRDYRGTPTFPYDVRWRVRGRLLPFASPRAVMVDASVEGLHHLYETPGLVEFDLDGTSHRLTLFSDGDSFDILFRDATSGVTTYGATRALSVDAPGGDGYVTLDFNRSINLFCAYTDYSTCPLPPLENRLSVAIEAGEKIPYERQVF
jgi:uncharacterized protein (DUF1684 family)